ncbi:RagB/SusD family nutrient uptake outer membrane protein [Phocaeicola dorei]|uniref:RagB/SusD family nutrient uptake outer membrane protein n=2 Tax=Phocaeicola dorei TaxID=357276 RepID=A0A6L3IR45_9BACT|nr:RagB/SusD family nutrient uptake outer membrane protein [Phocaeicola dorei]KAA5295025.1 RagB/SusD family nutrient uptake outer membrane protein [Phocaeicola dorei]KAA5298498.1 RagB/SusD family nutrient uptake outer membrane protein [Phocaeicola dorei]KAA5306164.1 RagB/SusD family nutrient uptake outer membrane protein [Phocaeicola dorei]KAA5313883.1 RagB/SusD family nutrient uptake outer membrane protein [Phocaeicola dorei]KAA5318654.1 RagB/SusD family nutrient uptake outer membrane protein
MKPIFSKIRVLGTAALALFLTASCSDILDEQPRSSYDPTFFKTEKGVEGGVTSMYAHLRYIYGQAYYYNSCLTGTDEATWGWSADGNFKDADLSGVGNLTATTCRSDALWGTAFSNINTANGVIENGAEVGVNESLVSEARFFRAFDYFLLVQTFGGVPLDLGSGELKFNITPSRTSVRNTVPEVYTKAIFPDLLTVIENLPANPRVTGGVTKTVARLYLAKAYLTYAWWLKNPNNIPTYPECQRTDPDGHDAAWYFQQAYDVAVTAIENPGPFGLQESFWMVNAGPNDRNMEILLYADHTQEDEYYNGGSLSYGGGGAPDNFAGWMMNWNYTDARSADNQAVINRIAEQCYGRPWTRMAPPLGVFTKTFADKVNDSRYDGTFTTVYRGNWSTAGQNWESVTNANGMKVKEREPIFSFVFQDMDKIDYAGEGSKSNLGAGTLPGRADWVLGLDAVGRYVYPGLWKLGPYRTDNGSGAGQPNAGSTRPYNIAKFSELYLVAAEAAVEGAATQAGKSARDLVNVLRARAGRWTYSNAEYKEVDRDFSAEMTAATPATIDINYILDERSREFYGEGYRWFDLVRTQKWNEYADSYVICGGKGDHNPQTYSRTIEAFHYLRPIPQGQLDGMEMTEEEKDAYQNPGYRD